MVATNLNAVMREIENKFKEAIADEEKAVPFYQGLKNDIEKAINLLGTKEKTRQNALYSILGVVDGILRDENRHRESIMKMLPMIQQIELPELTTQNIIEIHDKIIERSGGTKGILSQGNIDHLIYRFGREKDVFKQAAIALEEIITGHPFFDGNKRTAFEVADFTLRGKGYKIRTGEAETLNTLLKIAKYQCNVKQIENWLRKSVL